MERFVTLKRMRASAHDPFRLNRDLVRYRKGYPGESLNAKSSDNVKFYRNQIKSEPHGEFIETMHKDWATDYQELERNHSYIQWLFPIHEEGMNSCARVLQRHEAETMRKDPEIRERIKRSYSMMLGFYGAKIVDWETGELTRTENFASRFENLNKRWHNFLRITRILKFLGEVDFEHLKLPFLKFFAKESLIHKSLPSIADSLRNYWAGTLKDDAQLRLFIQLLDDPARLQEPSEKKVSRRKSSSAGEKSKKEEEPKEEKNAPSAAEEEGTEEASASQEAEQSQALTVAAEDECDELDPDSVPL